MSFANTSSFAQTSSFSHTSPPRPALGFSFHGLTPRDETLFKSYLRLLDHRTAQHWEHHQDRADVCIVAEGAPEPVAATAGKPRWQLTVGTGERQQKHFVNLPFRADQLESELNLLGALIMQVRNALSMKPAVQGEAFRLTRWPNPALLRTPERLRLATHMTGRPFVLQALHMRTGIAQSVCDAFVADLREARLLEPAFNAGTAPIKVADSGFANTRPPEQRPAVQQGLLARIRSRLGIAPTLSLQ